MTRSIRASLLASTPRLVLFCGLATAALTGPLISAAHADDHDYQNRRWNESRQERAHQRAHQQAMQQERWREQHRYSGYYRHPDVYYSAPPVVFQPPVYYQQPGASLNLSFPFLYH